MTKIKYFIFARPKTKKCIFLHGLKPKHIYILYDIYRDQLHI